MEKCYLSYKTKFVITILTVSMAFLFTSCYSNYLTIDYEVHWGAVWNDKHTKVAFVASKRAYRNAEGIAAFPDGEDPCIYWRMLDFMFLITKTNYSMS